MAEKPTYEELEQRVKELEKTVFKCKPAEEALIESEKLYRLIVENVTDIIWIVDMEMRFTYFSPSVTQMRGYSVEEAMAQSVAEAMTPASFESAMKMIAEELALHNKMERDPNRSRKIKAELTCKDGSTVWTEIESNFIYDSEGQPTGILGVTRNITERKESEKERKRAADALRESEERYKKFFDNALAGLFRSRLSDGMFIEMNSKAVELLGLPVEEVVGKVYSAGLYRNPGQRRELISKLKQDGEVHGFEADLKLYDGRDVTFSISVKAYPDKDYMEGAVIDITERKQAEEALRESEEKYRSVVENANEGITVTQDGMLKFINRKTVEFSGYSEEELMSRPFIEIVHPDDQQVVMQHHLKRLKGEEIPGVYVLRIIAKDGTIKWLESNGVIITWEGKPATLNLLSDITERKEMEEELLRAQKLESVGILAGGIAHDFNNILTTILGNVSLARMQVNPEDELFDLLREAETASTRAQTLTKQLLTFAKGGAPVKEIVQIKDVIKDSSLFVLRGSKSGCEFSIAEDLWPIDVDVGQISQVIDNIVINANQAMPKGGIIQVAAENLIIEDRHGLPVKPGRYVRISVIDQGVGIAEKHLLNIFDPYFTTKQEGSGLGLATTYSIVKKHDGHITVESRLGVGTTFHIYLPASDKAVPEKAETRPIKGQGRILVMDDEAPLRKMVGRMLKNLGYESEFAKDGAEAIRMYKEAQESEKPYDVV
ncbi:MAG: PAS domain S-box protein, partial [Desulfobulbaceae bacterium]|nr:PAS domain S-box protein [Desulfobulbaceae bacterium]